MLAGALRTLPVLAAALGLGLAVASPAALAGVANAGIPGAPSANPLAGLRWGHFTGPGDEVSPAYRAASGRDRYLLGLIATRPLVRWFGLWNPPAEATARQYIANVTGGDPNVLSQLAVFRMQPWEGEACRRLPTAAEQTSYRHWIDGFAAGIGSARVALILQPDLPFAACAPDGGRLPLKLVSYAAQKFSSLPHTTVYIDVGAADWVTVGRAVSLLRGAGVRFTRGFALNATHYDSTEREILMGAQVVRALARKGIAGEHFVINTATNGRPFTFQQVGSVAFQKAAVCRSRRSSRCVTLGIPPTSNVADPRWGLSRNARSLAARLVDAYLWIGRPWLDNQSAPFDLQRALALAGSTPF